MSIAGRSWDPTVGPACQRSACGHRVAAKENIPLSNIDNYLRDVGRGNLNRTWNSCSLRAAIIQRSDFDAFVYMYISKRLPPLPPTSGTRGMDAWMLGCLFLCLSGADLARIWVAFWRPLVICRVTWDGPCRPLVAFGLHWNSQGSPISYLVFLGRR